MKFFVIIALGVSLLFGAVDINTASKKELSSLNGIGSTKAEAIIVYRKANCFKNVKELAKVKGIGKKTVEKNMSDLSASPCKK
ncbi:ComEA family DNA-binding protein [Sulfurimonas sp. CS5]|uniref:ComEA family DNA-binding protein n=1 Tax=Sulfurimonas sp. CS5 TaxID=3391145 RepID=UPI0039EBA844